MRNYIAKDYKPNSSTGNNAGAYKLLKDKILAAVLALGLAGCATGLDAKFQLRSQSDPTKTRTESFEVGKKLAVENLSEYLGRPWDALPWNRYLIDRDYHTPFWREADKVICEKGGLRKAAEQALDAYIASAQEGADLIDAVKIRNEITKAGCEDYSQRGLSNALSKVPSNQLLEPLAKNLDTILENDEGFRGRAYFGDYVVDLVEVKGDKKKVAPELKWVFRRAVDGAILVVPALAAAGAFSGGGGAATRVGFVGPP